MKKYTVPCDSSTGKVPINLCVGEPIKDAHPLENQAAWLLRDRDMSIPDEVMESFRKLHEIALENNVSFEELCAYALGGSDQKQGEPAPGEDAPAED